jgi:hypothetical protein
MRQKETRMETRSKAKENFQAKAFKKHNDIGKSGFRLSMKSSYSVSTSVHITIIAM